MQKTRLGTDVMATLLKHVFVDLGYRRFEWKCDALNAPSRAAALRFGFVHEGVFRQAIVTRGRNRDTAWYSIIDREYPSLAMAYQNWLDPANLFGEGRHIRSLRVHRRVEIGRRRDRSVRLIALKGRLVRSVCPGRSDELSQISDLCVQLWQVTLNRFPDEFGVQLDQKRDQLSSYRSRLGQHGAPKAFGQCLEREYVDPDAESALQFDLNRCPCSVLRSEAMSTSLLSRQQGCAA